MNDGRIGTFGVATIVASAGFLTLGIAAPGMADPLLRMFLLTLASGFVLARAYRARLPARMIQDAYSPFNTGPEESSRTTPLVIRELTTQLRDADDSRRARSTAIPRSIRWALVDEAARRLADGHRLDLADPDDHAAIGERLSDTTWTLIAQAGAGLPRDARDGSGSPLVLSQLPLILDDLETL